MPFIGPFYVEPKTPTKYVRRNSVVVSPPGHETSPLKGSLARSNRASLDSPSKGVHFFDGQHRTWMAHERSPFQREVLQAPGSYFPARFPSEMSGATSRPHSKHAPHPPTSPLSEHFALNNHRANERKSRPGHHRRAKSSNDLLPLRPSTKQAAQPQLIIYAPSDAHVVIYPVFPVKQPNVRERSVFIHKGNAATGVAETAPKFTTRSRRLPPPVLLFQKQAKSLRRASTSSANFLEYPPSANDGSFSSTPRKTVRFADEGPRVPREFHNRVQADGI